MKSVTVSMEILQEQTENKPFPPSNPEIAFFEWFIYRQKGEVSITYQISQRIQFLTHQTALPSPPSNLTIHEIKEEAERHKRQRGPQIAIVCRLAETVSKTGEDGHDTAESYERKQPPSVSSSRHERRGIAYH